MKKLIKKYQNGGTKERIQSTTKKGDKWIYTADKKGEVSSMTVPKKGKSSIMYVDTTGYSKGKPTYKVKSLGLSPDKTIKRKDVLPLIKGMKNEVKAMNNYDDRGNKSVKEVSKPVSTKTMIDRNGKKTTKVFKPVAVNKSEAFRKGGKLHLGFKEAQAKIAKKQGVSMEAAGAILASSARKASPAAVKKNPALLNVKRGKVKKYQDGGSTSRTLHTGYKRPLTVEEAKAYNKKNPKKDTTNYLLNSLKKVKPVGGTKMSPAKIKMRKGGKKY